MNILFETLVGSHMWSMQHPGSDEDHFICHIVPTREVLNTPTKDILSQPGYQKSVFLPDEKTDQSIHEVGVVVEHLMRGSVNFLWGVMSPIIVKKSTWHDELKEIVQKNVARNCYHSIHGLAIHNFRKYIESGKDASPKRYITIARSIVFGINLLRSGKFRFDIMKDKEEDGDIDVVWLAKDEKVWYLEDLKIMIEQLDLAYKESKLPETPNEKEFRDWMFRVRMAEGKLGECEKCGINPWMNEGKEDVK